MRRFCELLLFFFVIFGWSLTTKLVLAKADLVPGSGPVSGVPCNIPRSSSASGSFSANGKADLEICGEGIHQTWTGSANTSDLCCRMELITVGNKSGIVKIRWDDHGYPTTLSVGQWDSDKRKYTEIGRSADPYGIGYCGGYEDEENFPLGKYSGTPSAQQSVGAITDGQHPVPSSLDVDYKFEPSVVFGGVEMGQLALYWLTPCGQHELYHWVDCACDQCSKEEPTCPVPEPLVLEVSDCCKQIVPDVGPDGNYSLNHMVQAAINVYECILCIVGALILMMLVFGSFMLLTSAGSDNRVGLGKKIILGAVIGGIIVFFSYLIVNFTVKALGGSFVNPGRMQISSSGSGGGVVSSASPAPLPSAGSNTTNTTPNIPKSNSSNSSKFENCSSSQQAFYNKALSFASGKNVPGQGDAATFLKSSFSVAVCNDPDCTADAAAFFSNNPNFKCNDFNRQPNINKVFICSWFFQQSSPLLPSAFLVHEAVHRQDCLAGIFDQPMSSSNNNCTQEQHAHTVMADYLEASGDHRQALLYRCTNVVNYHFYVNDTGPRCQAGVNYKKDPKCP